MSFVNTNSIDQEAAALAKKYNLESKHDTSNIEETITKSRQIIQQSKNLTLRNQQRKEILEEKFKSFLGNEDVYQSPERDIYKTYEDEKDYLRQFGIKKIWEATQESERSKLSTTKPQLDATSSYINKDLADENKVLKLELQSKNSEIINFKEIINKLQKENLIISEELKTVNRKLHDTENEAKRYEDFYNQKLKKPKSHRSHIRNKSKDSSIELTLKDDSQTVKQPDYSSKIAELEQRLLKSSQRYEHLKDRLEKAENLITRNTPIMAMNTQESSL